MATALYAWVAAGVQDTGPARVRPAASGVVPKPEQQPNDAAKRAQSRAQKGEPLPEPRRTSDEPDAEAGDLRVNARRSSVTAGGVQPSGSQIIGEKCQP